MDIEERWRALQKRLGYNGEELEILRSNPKYVEMVENTPQFMSYKIIAEVIESHGCHAQLKVGDKIVMNGNGQLILDECQCPKNLCVFAIAPLAGRVNCIFERFVGNLDPNGLLFDVVQCEDIGVHSGGWGKVLMKIRVEKPEKGK